MKLILLFVFCLVLTASGQEVKEDNIKSIDKSPGQQVTVKPSTPPNRVDRLRPFLDSLRNGRATFGSNTSSSKDSEGFFRRLITRLRNSNSTVNSTDPVERRRNWRDGIRNIRSRGRRQADEHGLDDEDIVFKKDKKPPMPSIEDVVRDLRREIERRCRDCDNRRPRDGDNDRGDRDERNTDRDNRKPRDRDDDPRDEPRNHDRDSDAGHRDKGGKEDPIRRTSSDVTSIIDQISRLVEDKIDLFAPRFVDDHDGGHHKVLTRRGRRGRGHGDRDSDRPRHGGRGRDKGGDKCITSPESETERESKEQTTTEKPRKKAKRHSDEYYDSYEDYGDHGDGEDY